MLPTIKKKLEMAGFQVDKGLARCMMDEKLYYELLDDLLKDTCYEKMLLAIEQKDVNEAFEQAHALKGATANLSMEELQKVLEPMVEILRVHSLEGIELYLKKVSVFYKKGIKVIKEVDDLRNS